ncbi:Holliday junction resolvase-like protein [Nanoarchaeota archaeon]
MVDFYLTTIIILIIGIVILLYLWLNTVNKLKSTHQEFGQLRHDHRSMYVKHGKAWENFVPFMPGYEKVANKDNTVFLGMPIDFMSFDDDSIKFIEVKTGKAKLSYNQQRIKKLVEEKKVEWHELRYTKK